MSLGLPALAAAVAARGRVARVLVARSAGSVPRGAGTSMLVWQGGQSGTIGGGALEFRAVALARQMLDRPGHAQAVTIPLGPGLGQCCGGAVSLVIEAHDTLSLRDLPQEGPRARPLGDGPGAAMPDRVARRLAATPPGAPPAEIDGWLIEAAPLPARPLWIWGAGHVGRALVQVMAPMPDVAITWIDTEADRFPAPVPEQVTQAVAADPVALVRHAPPEAGHLILTYSHEIDLALCHALLGHGFAHAGLIGSGTKWARFRNRLAALGHAPADIARIACPIGDPRLGKHPQAIAVGVAAALLMPAGNAARATDRTG